MSKKPVLATISEVANMNVEMQDASQQGMNEAVRTNRNRLNQEVYLQDIRMFVGKRAHGYISHGSNFASMDAGQGRPTLIKAS